MAGENQRNGQQTARTDYSSASGGNAQVSTPDQQAWAQFQRERARIAEGTQNGTMTQAEGADALGAAFEELGRQLGDPALIQRGIEVRQQFVGVPKEVFDQFLEVTGTLASAAGNESIRQRGTAISQGIASVRDLFQNNMSLEMSIDSMQATACGILKMIGTFASAFGFKEFGDQLIASADEYAPELNDGNYQRYFDRLDNFNVDVDVNQDDLQRGVSYARGLGEQAAGDVNRYDRYDRQDDHGAAPAPAGPAAVSGSPLAPRETVVAGSPLAPAPS